MTEINLSDYVLESKAELGELADAIREKSGAEGSLSVNQMTERVATLYPTSTLAGLIDRSITEIEIPSGVTAIGMYAFQRCNSLTTVKFNEGLETLGSNCFSLCNSLKKIDLPHGVKYLNFAAFQNTPLNEISLPSTLETIAQYALIGTKLTTLTIPNSVTSISSSGLTNTLKTIYCDWAEGEKPTIEANAPWGAANADIVYLRTVIDADGTLLSLDVEKNEWRVVGFDYKKVPADYSAIDLVIESEYRDIPVTEIADNAFDKSQGCPVSLKSIVIPDTIKRIGNYAFSDQFLTSVTIPDSVDEVGNGAFYYNYNLNTATLGYGCLWRVGNAVFVGCSNLTDIYVNWDDGNNDGAPWGAENATIHYANGVVINPM